ncbi:hypothetical protein [uncultured Vibrio sp.]|uniref:hypothetical protein n=1 Tax=uncultured Vibrio sp. TaxID=114054 RepID=UPI00091E97EF|nr:hypothetical protein [uncultured Vibrio sp.]OIQ25573.1 MAG: hypothetical protein BM561_05745 [Vibrio sp. MedPE-SWchi]
MITVHRNYQLRGNTLRQESNSPVAHVVVNPVGTLDVEIRDKNIRHQTDLSDITFKPLGAVTKICGKDKQKPWELELDVQDASELNKLIGNAHEEYEILMRDL